ncbi:helix-turn-helix transcriptional regulator [Shewanella donghaensis]|uniref:helix-turn-helix transcriptional regulator n=1 Tax=Shewanella donghaensis TaxID=238836 RepID=UPI00118335CE|nr:helix-turn-helix transcriptional regulator [Shewanella donghaensis]
MESQVLGTVFNKSNFSNVLRQYRKSYRLSQQALADDLANNHSLFKNINQSMVSLWEKGTIQPSLNRRVGLANFFKQDYQYDDHEMKVLKKAQKLRSTHAEMSNIYDYNINQIKEFWYEEMSEDQKSVIFKAHKAHSGFHFEETLEHIESKKLKVVCFYYNNSLVGHLAFCAAQNGLFKIASLVAIDKQIKLNIFKFIQTISSEFELVIPSFIKYYSNLFSDIYLDDVKTSSPITLHSGKSSSIFGNPFVQHNLSGNDDLILLRYAQKCID